MIQFEVLSGKTAGTQLVARRFPVRAGRAPGNEIQLEEDGVWDRHFIVELDRHKGFTLTTGANALVAINGRSVQSARLRNGDVIQIGSARLQFWLAATRQRGLRVRESCVWILFSAVFLSQFAFIYWLWR